MNTQTIQSLKDLQLRMPAIIRQYGSDNNFTHLALANPIIALERTGLNFTDEAKTEIENYVRFGREGVQEHNALKEKINSTAGTTINLQDNEALADTILALLTPAASPKAASQSKKTYQVPATPGRDELVKLLSGCVKKIDNKWQDGLSSLAALHPIIPLLLQYRQQEANRPGFALSGSIAGIEEKLRQTPLTNVVFSLQRNDKAYNQ